MSEPLAMPAHHRVRAHDQQGAAPVAPRVPEEHPKESIPSPKVRASSSARQRGQLLPQCEILECDGPVPSTEQSDGSEEYDYRRQHSEILSRIGAKINPARPRSGNGEGQPT